MLFADAGVPMIAIYWPPAWLLLLPVIALEAWLARRMLRTAWPRAWAASALANVASTVVGIPATWLVLAVIELRWASGAAGLQTWTDRAYAVTVQAPWLIPYERHLWWMVPAAAGMLSVAFWAVSAVSERYVAGWLLRGADPTAVWRWALTANAASYALLWAAVAAGFGAPAVWATEASMWVAELAFKVVGAIMPDA
jgi:hypothetical protein